MKEFVQISRSGPACHGLVHLKEYSFSMDFVFCFRCECPALLDKWSHRKRYGSWPTQEMIDQVNSLDAHVVPVGVKGHMLQFTQWRICFTLGETYLLNTLKESMLQVYAVMKKLTSTVIKPVCSEVTSYIVKNIVLWMAETLPTDKLEVVQLLMKAILLLKLTVKAEYLPSYMIPERNLFQNKLSLQEKLNLDVLLMEMLQERGAMVLRNPRIAREMCFVYSQPELLDLRKIINELFTRYPMPNDEAFHQILSNNLNNVFSLMNSVGIHDVQNSIHYSSIIKKLLRLPLTTALQLIEMVLGIRLGCLNIPCELKIGDILTLEEFCNLPSPGECHEMIPNVLSGCGADDINNDFMSLLLNHPETRRFVNITSQFIHNTRYMGGT